ncbi:hypothetical protein Bca4012_077625 [Brassica carinata]
MVETSEKTSSPSSSSHGRKDLEFFKVYLPEFSSHQLVIPQAFINILDKPLPKRVVLVDEIGRLWDVETKTGVVVFRQGWEKFANEHSLEFGDFLLFRYNGESRFDVTIFAKDGCKKDLDRFRVSVEKEPVIVKPVGISIKPEPWEDCGKRVMQNRKRVLVREEASVLGDIEPGHRRNTRKKVNRSRDPREMSWVPEKKHKGSEEPVYKPKNPHFVRNIAVGSLRLLEIPTTFLKANGIELEEGQDIELCDENGKKWPLKIEKHGRGYIFSYDSWLCFCESHNLRNPNKCLFEFIVSSNGTCSQILVRIFRGTLLTTAAKSGYHPFANLVVFTLFRNDEFTIQPNPPRREPSETRRHVDLTEEDEIIRIPACDLTAVSERFKRTLIGRVLHRGGRSVEAMIALFPRACIWNVEGRACGVNLGNGRFRFDFDKEKDLNMVLNKRPCHFNHWIFALER